MISQGMCHRAGVQEDASGETGQEECKMGEILTWEMLGA